jgi:hypothetical protein
MSSASNPRITLELVPGADPIRGSIEHGDGTRESFWGWLELIDELGRIATDSRSSPPQPGQGHTHESPQPGAGANQPRPHTTTEEQP